MKILRTLGCCLGFFLFVSAAHADDFEIRPLKQPSIPVSFKALHVSDDPVSEKSELSFMVENKSGAGVTTLEFSIFYLGADGKIRGGEGMRYFDLHTMSDGTLTGAFPLFPRSLAKAAKLIVISFVRVDGLNQTWRESTDQILKHLEELQPDSAVNADTRSKLVAINLGIPNRNPLRQACLVSYSPLLGHNSPASNTSTDCPPLPCDPEAFCTASEEEALLICERQGLNLYSFKCNVTCAGCSNGFTCG